MLKEFNFVTTKLLSFLLQQIVLEENNINQLALSIFLGYAPNHLGMAKFHEI
jgi:hypothetical protein